MKMVGLRITDNIMLLNRRTEYWITFQVQGNVWVVMRKLELQPVNANVRFEVFTAVTKKNVVFWDIKTHFVHHRRHITSPL
jgi:hypothetical protein